MTDQPRPRRYSIGVAIDWFFFVFAGLAAVWLAYLSLTDTFRVGWWGFLFVLAFWVLLAYLVLPRLHRILTTIYVPDYFIGRARTSDGLLGDPVNPRCGARPTRSTRRWPPRGGRKQTTSPWARRGGSSARRLPGAATARRR